MQPLPRILCIGGHDPTGGAGIQADIETVSALGGRAVTLVTCATVQDTRNVEALLPIDAGFFSHQLARLMADISPKAIKIGLIGSATLIEPLADLVAGFDGPIVLDPVLAAGGGFDFDAAQFSIALRQRLLPYISLITPNRAELGRLVPDIDEVTAAEALIAEGLKAVLVTGADEAEGDKVVNRLHQANTAPQHWEWLRLPKQYHGSGCTLAAACATRLALHEPLAQAVEQAQQFTWQALARAEAVGQGQWLPLRGA